MTPHSASKDAPGASKTESDALPEGVTGQMPALFKEVQNMTAVLNAIRSELASQSEQVHQLHQNSTKNPLPEFPPRQTDWDRRALHAWYQSLVPDEARLQKMCELFCTIFKSAPWHNDTVRMVTPEGYSPKEPIPVTSLPQVIRCKPAAGIDRLKQAWPSELTTDVPESEDRSAPDKESKLLYFQWLCPWSIWFNIGIESLEVQYDPQGYPEVRNARSKVYPRLLRISHWARSTGW
jgi:hypothetical protein